MRFLISVLLALCGCGGHKEESWKTPNVYFVRNDGNKSTVLTKRTILLPNDSIEVSGLQKSDQSITAMANCVTDKKRFSGIKTVSKNSIQLIEFLPVQALLSKNGTRTFCELTIKLINSSGSTKTYVFGERIIDFKTISNSIKVPKFILQKNFHAVKLSPLEEMSSASIVCDSFVASTKMSDASQVTLQQLIDQHKQKVIDIDFSQYKPHQSCRIVQDSDNRRYVSNLFEIRFQKLTPKYRYIIYRYHQEGPKLILYALTLINHHDVPISIALKKESLKVPRSVSIDSSLDKWISKNDVYVMLLEPGEKLFIKAYVIDKWGRPEDFNNPIQPKHLPIYYLEYNYRTEEEIERASGVKVLQQIPQN